MSLNLAQRFERVTKLSALQRLSVAIVIGALAGGAMAPFHHVFALIPGFSGLLLLVASSARGRSAFLVGWCFGVGHFGVGFYWVGHAFLVDAAAYGWMAPIAVLGLAAGISIFLGFVTLITWHISRKFSADAIGQVLILAAVWATFEWVRSWLFTGFPWNLIGTVWANSDAMMQFAAYAGVYGLGMITIIAAAMPAVLVLRVNDRRARSALALCTVLAALIWIGGTWRLGGPQLGHVSGVHLRLVQPNIPQHLKWKPGLINGHIEKQLKMSVKNVISGPAPTHIIWPETAIPNIFAGDPRFRAHIGQYIPENGLLIAGATRGTPAGTSNPTYWNSIHAFEPSGDIVNTYDKRHLVPFGEYVPFRNILGFTKLTEGRTDFTPGNGARVWNLPGLPVVAPLICYEAIFPSEVTALEDDPEWLLNVTNDAWFGMSAGPYQHFAAVRFRAIEMGLPLVRVANTGISGVVDAYGRIEANLDLGIEGTIDAALPRRLTERPLYGRFGDWMTLILVLVTLLGGILLGRGQRVKLGSF